MKRVFCHFLPGQKIIPLLYPNKGFTTSTNTLFMDRVFENFKEPVVELVTNPDDADYLLIPHPYQGVRNAMDYLGVYEDLSRKTGKKILVFLYGDSDETVPLKNAIVIRTSQYSYKKRENEIMMPAYSEDLLGGRPLTIRQKSDQPTVGFCGWSKPRDVKNVIGTNLKNVLVHLKALANRNYLSEIKGITLRSKSLDALRQTPGIRCNFIERSSYSGHRETIKMDPEQSRKEFIANIEGSDFILCAKGDGNFSYRFYETLCMGRIPLLLDTHCCLPLENEISYDDFVCRVPLSDIDSIGVRMKEFYDRCTPEQWEQKQRLAREVFEKQLSAPVFLRRLFEEQL